MTAPTPNIRAPTAITVRLIGLFSVFANVSTQRRDPRFREAAAWQYLEPHCGDLFPHGPQVSEAVPALVLADRDPDPLGGRRHVDMSNLVFAPEDLDDDVIDDLDDAGRRIDFNFRQMGAVRIGAVGAGERRAGVQFRGIDARTLCQLGEADRAVGAGDPDHAIADLEVGSAGFQRFGGNFLQLVAEFAGRALDTDAAGRNRR